MHVTPLSFPRERPESYAPLPHEPAFDPVRHLALEPPRDVWHLADFGYAEEEIRKCASKVAVAGPFRLLSDEGTAAARSVALSLREACRTSDRTAKYVAGGVYRSRFLRDLCNSTQVSDFLSGIAGCALLPHNMPSQQLYINFAPDELTSAVDTWHVDSIGFDYVLLLSDPRTFEGGQFQFFKGTTTEAARLLGTDVDKLTDSTSRDLPPERVVSAPFPAAGYALFQQGNMVIHRATRLTRRAERITMVPGLIARDTRCPDPTNNGVIGWAEPGLLAEFARHKAWLSLTKLGELVERVRLDAEPPQIRDDLQRSIADVLNAISAIDGHTRAISDGDSA
jgi:hypothetical protein